MQNTANTEPVPPLVIAQAILPSRSGMSAYNWSQVNQKNIQEIYTDFESVERARDRLTKVGFQVWYTPPGVARETTVATKIEPRVLPNLLIAGPPELFQDTLGVALRTTEIGPKKRQITHLIFGDTFESRGDGTGYITTKGQGALGDMIEGVALSAPVQLFAPTPTPPSKDDFDYFYLQLPDDLAAHLNTNMAHINGFKGDGIRVAMIDTGHIWHPYFQDQDYRREDVVLAPLAADPDRDDHGHGTGESANLYAIAPQATLIPVKARLLGTKEGKVKDKLIAVTEAFKTAASLDPAPDIITCSWGYDLRTRSEVIKHDAQVLEHSIIDAIDRQIVVVFAAGNGGVRGFPAQHPDVIAAGGVYISEAGQVQASDLASAFKSNIQPYVGRQVPDVCGLVGLAPSGRYLMLPVPPGSKQDQQFSPVDKTLPDDGWAVFSGTSAAAPQIAGVIALMLQARPELTPKEVKQILRHTARDVTEGKAASTGGRQAQAGPFIDLATGAGLVDATAAVNSARNHS